MAGLRMGFQDKSGQNDTTIWPGSPQSGALRVVEGRGPLDAAAPANDIEPLCSAQKRVLDAQPVDALPVLQILGQKALATALQGGRHDQAVVEGEALARLEVTAV